MRLLDVRNLAIVLLSGLAIGMGWGWQHAQKELTILKGREDEHVTHAAQFMVQAQQLQGDLNQRDHLDREVRRNQISPQLCRYLRSASVWQREGSCRTPVPITRRDKTPPAVTTPHLIGPCRDALPVF